MPQRNEWGWKLVNNRRKQEVGGTVATKMRAIEAAEAAEIEHGLHGVVVTITSPRGIVFTHRPHAYRSGVMVWDRD